jgi:hypothetical protein
VSGEVIIVAPPESFPHRALVRLGDLGDTLPPFALVAGRAGVSRLGQAHRATADLDAVSDAQERMLELLVASGYPKAGDSVTLEPDMTLDVLDVSEGDPEYIPYLTHRYAFETRATVDVRVVAPDGEELARASVPTATAGALVVMKLGISEGVGRRRDPRKVGSDAFDFVRLLLDAGPDEIARELNEHASRELRVATARLVDEHMIDHASPTAAAIIRSSTAGVYRISVDQITRLGRALRDRLAVE